MIVGIDIGTQSFKVVVTDKRLRLLGTAARGYEYESPQPGWAQQHPQVWEDALAPAISDALREAALSAEDIEAVGVCGQLDGCVAVDRASGEPLSTCLIWCDRRAEPLLASLDEAALAAHPGIVADASHPAAKASWLRRDGGLGDTDIVFHQPVSYMVRRLSGEHVIDHGLASITMLYDLHDRDWHPNLLRLFALRRDELPRIAAAESVAGHLTAAGASLSGLKPGTVVAVGTGDDFSNPLGAGVVAPGTLVCCLGTAEVNGVVIGTPMIDTDWLLQTTAFPGGGWFLENPGWLAGGAVRWAMRTFRIDNESEFDCLAAEAPPGCDGVVFLPALSGTTAPEWHADARGCFYGLTPAHGLHHIARAVLEGCAFAMRDVYERIDAMGVAVDAVRMVGGGTHSRLWAHIRADLTGLPVDVPEQVDTSPIGAAMLALVACGGSASLASAARHAAGPMYRIVPKPENAQVYDEAWRNYRKLFESLKPMFVRTANQS